MHEDERTEDGARDAPPLVEDRSVRGRAWPPSARSGASALSAAPAAAGLAGPAAYNAKTFRAVDTRIGIGKVSYGASRRLQHAEGPARQPGHQPGRTGRGRGLQPHRHQAPSRRSASSPCGRAISATPARRPSTGSRRTRRSRTAARSASAPRSTRGRRRSASTAWASRPRRHTSSSTSPASTRRSSERARAAAAYGGAMPGDLPPQPRGVPWPTQAWTLGPPPAAGVTAAVDRLLAQPPELGTTLGDRRRPPRAASWPRATSRTPTTPPR